MVHRKETSKALFRDGSRDCLGEGRGLRWGKWGWGSGRKGDRGFGRCCRLGKDGVVSC